MGGSSGSVTVVVTSDQSAMLPSGVIDPTIVAIASILEPRIIRAVIEIVRTIMGRECLVNDI